MGNPKTNRDEEPPEVKLSFVLGSSGDRSVGINPWENTITVSFDWDMANDAVEQKEIEAEFRRFLKETYGADYCTSPEELESTRIHEFLRSVTYVPVEELTEDEKARVLELAAHKPVFLKTRTKKRLHVKFGLRNGEAELHDAETFGPDQVPTTYCVIPWNRLAEKILSSAKNGSIEFDWSLDSVVES